MLFLFKQHAFSVQTAFLFMPFPFNQQTYSCILRSNNIFIYAFSVQTAFLFMHFQFKQHFIYAFSVQTAFLFMHFQFKQHFIYAFSVQTAFLFMYFQFKQHFIYTFSVQKAFLFIHFQFKDHFYQFFTLFEQAQILLIFEVSSNKGSGKPAQICRLSSAFIMRGSRGGDRVSGPPPPEKSQIYRVS